MNVIHRMSLTAKTVCAAAVTLALSGAVIAVAQEQTGATQAAPKQPWTVSCAAAGGAADLTCRMSQVLRTRNGNQRVLTVAIEKAPSSPETIVFALPHGVDLTKGVAASVDGGQAREVAIQTADAAGSYGRLPVDADLLASLRAGRTLNVAFFAANGQRVETQVSLNGFSSAFEKL